MQLPTAVFRRRDLCNAIRYPSQQNFVNANSSSCCYKNNIPIYTKHIPKWVE